MLSVCIPVYNFFIEPLVNELVQQCDKAGIEYEILVIDDASALTFKEQNKQVQKNAFVVFHELPENIGRSRIRNLLAKKARYKYLLFLDCDVSIQNTNFISNYLNYLETNTKLICGGRIYNDSKSDREHILRYTYGLKVESQPAAIRSQNPSNSFMTNNFVIEKELFKHIQFNEHLAQYGHEDTLFGYELSKLGIVPLHIENPVLNGDVETNALFLQKTKQGLENLAFIYQSMQDETDFIQQVKLLRFYKKFCCKLLLVAFFPFVALFLHAGLTLGLVNLKLFNLYKLSYFARQLVR